MSDENKGTRTRKAPTLDQLAAYYKSTRLAIAKAAGVPPEKVNLDKLEPALEKAKADICQALGVPNHAIELTVNPAGQA